MNRPEWIDPTTWERTHPNDREWLAGRTDRRTRLDRIATALELVAVAWVYISIAMLLFGVRV